MKKIKIGIIGVGNIAQEHIYAYKQNPNVELYAFCDIDPVRLKEMGELHGITRCYQSEREMLDALPTAYGAMHGSCVICEESLASVVSRLLTVESRMSFSFARVIAT